MTDHEQPPRSEGDEPSLVPTEPIGETAYEPLPPEGESAAQVLARLDAAGRQTAKANGPTQFYEDKQLTIGQLLLVTLVLAICMGVLRLVDPPTGAALTGCAVLGGLIVARLLSPPIPLAVQVAWYGLIVVYVVMCIVAYRGMK